MDIKERVIPGISANYLIQQSLSKYLFFKRLIKKGNIVLDLGCGTGYGTNTLVGKNVDIHAIDINSEAIKYAIKKYSKKIKFYVRDAELLVFKDNYFDAICCFEVIEHVKNPEILLREVKRVLNVNGIFVISTPNRIICSPEKIENRYHLREYSFEELNNILCKYFDNVKIYGQSKTKIVDYSYKKYLNSQDIRQFFVNIDFIKIRKLMPDILKENMWVLFGGLFGRNIQNSLTHKDFPISTKNVNKSENFIAVCINS